MNIFEKKKVKELPEKKPYTIRPKGGIDDISKIDFTEEELLSVDKEFDMSLISEDLQMFVRYYILNGGNGTQAYYALRKGKIPRTSCKVSANHYLRRLRSHPGFWDMLGLGYENLKEVVDDLKKTKPEKAIDIIMKVNKEDTERIEGSITVLLANELSREFK